MPASAAIPRTVLNAAFAFDEGGLWRHLEEENLFAIRYTDGRTGYCYVESLNAPEMASEEEDGDALGHAPSARLVLFMEGTAMALYRNMRRMQKKDEMIALLNAINQMEYLACQFEPVGRLTEAEKENFSTQGVALDGLHMAPRFTQKRTYADEVSAPSEEDCGRLRYALLAAASLGRQATANGTDEDATNDALEDLGFFAEGLLPLLTATPLHREGFVRSVTSLPQEDQLTLGMPEVDAEAVYAPVRRLPQGKRKAVFCELFQVAREDEDDGPDRRVGLIILAQDASVISAPAVNRFEEDMEGLLAGLSDTLRAYGKPAMLVVRDTLTALLLTPFAQQTGIKLQVRKAVPQLEEVLMRYYFAKMEESGFLEALASPDGDSDAG